ncbi:ATP-binding cassette sub- D member 4 [Chytriomyces hyalinus]|nr:ATP-binding cassette sub- D member 4 [Chytriomyces hyalinus]
MHNNATRAGQDARIDAKLLQRLFRLLRIGFGRSGAVGWFGLLQARLLVPLLMTLSICGEVVVFIGGTAMSAVYPALATRDGKRFAVLITSMSALYILDSAIKAAVQFASGLLGLCVRRALTRRLHRAYLKAGPLYAVATLLKTRLVDNSKETNPTRQDEDVEMGDESDYEEDGPDSALLEADRRRRRTSRRRRRSQVRSLLLDNPDQTIVQDVEKFSEMITTALGKTMTLPFLIGYYTYQVCETTQTMYTPVIISVFFVVSWLLCRRAMNPVVPAVIVKEQKEGDFRFNHVHLRTAAEPVAMMHAEAFEKRRLDTLLDVVIDATYTAIRAALPLNYWTNITGYLGAVLSYCLVSIPVFDGTYNGKTEAEIAGIVAKHLFVSLYLIHQFTLLTNFAEQLAQLSGLTARISLLLETCTKVDEILTAPASKSTSNILRRDRRSGAPRPSQKLIETPLLQVTNLPCAPPPPFRVLYKQLYTVNGENESPRITRTAGHLTTFNKITFSIRAGQHTLITGPSGCGKTSLLRVLAHVWRHPNSTSTAILYDPSLLALSALVGAAPVSDPSQPFNPSQASLEPVYFHPSQVMFLPQQGFATPLTPYSVSSRASAVNTSTATHPDAAFFDTSAQTASYSGCLAALAAQLTYPAHPGETGITDADIERLLALVGLDHVVERAFCMAQEMGMEMGVDGCLEDVGCRVLGQLSGGEMQRVQIARVLYWRPRIVFMDEALSMLDAESEQRMYGLLMLVPEHDHDDAVVEAGHDDEVERRGVHAITVVSVSHSEREELKRLFSQQIVLG